MPHFVPKSNLTHSSHVALVFFLKSTPGPGSWDLGGEAGDGAEGHSRAVDLRGMKALQTRGGPGLAPADSGFPAGWVSLPLSCGMRSELSCACRALTVLHGSLELAAMDSFSSVQSSSSVVSDSL